MAKKTCPNGHVYDPNIYGDQCPLCPSSSDFSSDAPKTQIGSAPGPAPFGDSGMHTHIAGGGFQGAPQGNPGMPPTPPQGNPTGPTVMRPQDFAPQNGNRTVIRHANPQGGPAQKAPSRKLVGFLITYNRDPNGKAYNIYEGRNYIGRDSSCDICIPDDDQMSGRHLSILYRNVDNKFKFRDEQSSNGTFVNKELIDSGELENYDIIRAGSTIFIFLAIPRI